MDEENKPSWVMSKKIMKNQSGRKRKTSTSLALEGGGKSRAARGVQDDALNLIWFRGWGCKNTREAILTPHPDPLPQGERGDNF
jgi:hypothetical protein